MWEKRYNEREEQQQKELAFEREKFQAEKEKELAFERDKFQAEKEKELAFERDKFQAERDKSQAEREKFLAEIRNLQANNKSKEQQVSSFDRHIVPARNPNTNSFASLRI